MMEGTVSSGQSFWEITEIPKNTLLYYISLKFFRPVSVLIPKSHGFYNSRELLHYLPRRYISSQLSMEKGMH